MRRGFAMVAQVVKVMDPGGLLDDALLIASGAAGCKAKSHRYPQTHGSWQLEACHKWSHSLTTSMRVWIILH
jgi:hypothetical protein